MELDINEILAKHSKNFATALEFGREDKVSITASDAKDAIKEILEKYTEIVVSNVDTDIESHTTPGLITFTMSVVDEETINECLNKVIWDKEN